MTKADDLKVCPVCWVHHADFNCPRAAESEALRTALAHLLEGGAVPIADSSEGQTTTNVGPVVTETGGADMDVDTQGEDIGDTEERPAVADPQDYTDVEIDDSDMPKTDEEPPTIAPKLKPRAKSRPIQKTTSNKMSIDESNAAKSVKFLDADEDVSPLGKPRESESVDMSNVQQLKNQVPPFLEYASPRPFNSGHFVNSEGAVDWTRGRPPLTGRVRNLRALEMMVATLQRDEDREGTDYDFGGTSQYLDQKHEQNLVASLIDNGTGRIRFIDQSCHCLGKWGDKNCEFLADEIYHAGKRLSMCGKDTYGCEVIIPPTLIEADGHASMKSFKMRNFGWTFTGYCSVKATVIAKILHAPFSMTRRTCGTSPAWITSCTIGPG